MNEPFILNTPALRSTLIQYARGNASLMARIKTAQNDAEIVEAMREWMAEHSGPLTVLFSEALRRTQEME